MIVMSTKATPEQLQARLELRKGSRTSRHDGAVRTLKHNRAAAKAAVRKEAW